MCRGVEEEQKTRQKQKQQPDGLCSMKDQGGGVSPFGRSCVSCELCGSRASLYCQADTAFLCRECDRRVHEANFLARRHVRCFLCNTCQNLTRRCLVGTTTEVLIPVGLEAAETADRTRTCNNNSNNNDDNDFRVEENSPGRTKTLFQFI